MVLYITVLKLLAVFLLSVLFGLERQRSHKPVGFSTFTFVALGSCALGIVATDLFTSNPTSLLSATVTGIGFLGAGALINKGTDKVFGFTSASGIWLFAILGLSVGIGEYVISGIVYVMAWVVILFDKYLEKHGVGSYQKKLVILTNRILSDNEIKEALLSYTNKHKLISVEINKADKEMKLQYLVDGTRESVAKMLHDLFKKDWLKKCEFE